MTYDEACVAAGCPNERLVIPGEPMLVFYVRNGSKYGVPLRAIAEHYIANNSDEPEHTSDDLEYWAANNMRWDDIARSVVKLSHPPAPDFPTEWIYGRKEIEGV